MCYSSPMNRISQYLVYPIIRFLNILFVDVEFVNPEGFKAVYGKSAVLIANHVSYYDSFLLRLNSYSVGLSLHFMGVKKFNLAYMRFLWSIGIVPLVYKLFGVFLVYPGQGIEKNLITPKMILSKGNNQILIFPEGSVNKTGVLNPFKRGAATLISVTNVPVLPISYKVTYAQDEFCGLTKVCKSDGRKKIIITLGEVMNFPQGTSLEEINKQLEDKLRGMLE